MDSCSWTPTLLRPWYEVCFFDGCHGLGVGVMVTFLDVAHMDDATAMMGVLGWGGG